MRLPRSAFAVLFCSGPLLAVVGGTVVADDGMSFLTPVAVELICGGEVVASSQASREGRFEIAADSSEGCEVRATSSGYRPARIAADELPLAPEIPSLVLSRRGRYQGESISVTHLDASPEAREAFRFGIRAMRDGDGRSAVEQFRRAVDLEQNYAAAWFELGRLLLALDDAESARAAFESGGRSRPMVLGSLRTTVVDRIKRRRCSARRRTLPPISAHQSHRVAVMRSVALFFLLSALAGGQTLELSPRSLAIGAEAQAKLADSVEAGRWHKAEAVLFAAARERPDNAGILRALGVVAFQVRRYFAAAQAFRRSDSLQPLGSNERFALATAYVRLGRRHWARRELERLVEENPEAAEYRFELSGVHYFYQWFERASLELLEVIRLDPGHAAAHDRLGQCYEGLGELDRAAERFRAAIDLNEANVTSSPWPAYHLGSLLHDRGELEAAEIWLDRATTLDPGQTGIQFELGAVFLKRRKWTDAVRAFQAVTELEPGNSRALYSLAQAYRRAGKAAEADATLARYRERRQR